MTTIIALPNTKIKDASGIGLRELLLAPVACVLCAFVFTLFKEDTSRRKYDGYCGHDGGLKEWDAMTKQERDAIPTFGE